MQVSVDKMLCQMVSININVLSNQHPGPECVLKMMYSSHSKINTVL